MIDYIEKLFIGLITKIDKVPKHTKCVYLSYQKCTAKPTLINLYPTIHLWWF